jgi:signal transduction histidine kinase
MTLGNRRGEVAGALPLLIVGFGSLVGLLLLSGVTTYQRALGLYGSLSELNQNYRRSWRSLDEIRTGIHVSSVLIRDYLLDPSDERTREIKAELLELRRETEEHLSTLELVARAPNHETLNQLRLEVNGYWESLDPVFEWTAADKMASGFNFLRRRIMPRREAAVRLANEIQSFTDTTFTQQKLETVRREAEFGRFLRVVTIATTALGVLVAIASIMRLRRLEKRAERHRMRTERAENEMRRLSQQVVHAQEEERKSLSRELHDEIGQMLTGLRMDLRSLRRLNGAPQAEFDARVNQSCTLLEQTLQSVRDIAMGLRPSMLDDFGLEAALHWQVRQFEKRHNVDVQLEVDGSLGDLPERQRTNLYRIVQEGLTNCARHAKASSILVRLRSTPDGLVLEMEDNGVGISGQTASGLGLVGIQERVRELAGNFRVSSAPGKGTRLIVELPPEQEAARV